MFSSFGVLGGLRGLCFQDTRPDWLLLGGQWHFPLANKTKRKAAASSLLNRILLNRNTLCNEMQFNYNNIMVISISTSEEMPQRNAFELSKSSPGCPHEGISCMVIRKPAFPLVQVTT